MAVIIEKIGNIHKVLHLTKIFTPEDKLWKGFTDLPTVQTMESVAILPMPIRMFSAVYFLEVSEVSANKTNQISHKSKSDLWWEILLVF